MDPHTPNPAAAEPRNDRKALVDIQLADIKAFTESANCSSSDLQNISIHLAVMMAKISSKPGSNMPALQPAHMSSSTSTSEKPVSTLRRDVIRYIRRPHSAHKRKGGGVQKKVLSVSNGGLVPVIAALRGARKKSSERIKVRRNETSGSGMFGNLSFRIRENGNGHESDKTEADGGMDFS
ncbi:hypothetical protein IFR05_008427 [Cadophora sp. M221]|nr:hypothetical protein IFR05_008427 [Cadophora sp. M221]